MTAILYITWRPDGPSTPILDDDPTNALSSDTGSMIVCFDTAYGFGYSQGWSCSDLHAYFITRLSEEFGLLTWHNEYTGDWQRYDAANKGTYGRLRLFGDPNLGHLAADGVTVPT